LIVYNLIHILRKLFFILNLFLISYNSYSQEVVINEVNVNPSGLDTSAASGINANSLYNVYSNYQPATNREWIELFNPSSSESVDIGCYTLGSNTSNFYLGDNWGALTFPSGTIIPPLGYLIVGGNASDVPTLDFDLNYYRYNFFQIEYIDGDYYRWFFRNNYGWCAIYNPNGDVVDAIYWTDSIGNQSSLYDQEEFWNPIYSMTTCSGDMGFPAAIDIPDIEFVGIIHFEDSTFQRIPDGGEWADSQAVATPRNCNGGCYDYIFQNVCAADIMHFNVVNLTNNQVDSALWDFGDYSSGNLNYSTDTVTSHYYLLSGDYDVKLIVYFDNFSDTIIKTVTVFNNPQVDLGSDLILCPNKTITLHAGTGFSNYLWNTSSIDSLVIVSSPGNYWVQVGLGSCTDADTINVSFYNTSLLNLGNDTSICENESITFYAGNSFSSYLWQNSSNSQTFTTNQIGTYWVETTDVNSCVQRDSITLGIMQMPFIELGNDTLVCDNPAIILNALNSGANYLWSTNEISQQINVSTSGNYYLTVTNNCGNYIDSVSVSFNQKPQFLLTDTTICVGDSAIISINNIYDSYLWSTGETSNVITIKNGGNYSVSVTNNCGITSKSLTITAINQPSINLGNDTLVCDELSLVLSVLSDNLNYFWSTNESTQQITVTESGKYFVTVSNNCGVYVDSVLVSFNQKPQFLLNDTTICVGDSAIISINNIYDSYSWSTGEASNVITIKNGGNYSVSVTNNCGITSKSLTITAINQPIIDLGNDTLICDDSIIVLNAQTVNSTYIWSSSQTSSQISVSESGKYSVTVTNQCGNDTSSINIDFDKAPVVNIRDTVFCNDDSINFSVDNNINNILWSTGESSDNIFLKNPGEYTISLSNSCGNIIDTFNLVQLEKPIFFLGFDMVIEKGNYINLVADYPNTDCIWSTGDTSHSISVSESGYYWASLKNICGIVNDTIRIEVSDCSSDIVIPNTFSPNGDGLNDAIILKNDCNIEMSFDIYSRWGALVYRSSAKVITWEGTTFSGVTLSEGVYYYILTYSNMDNNTESVTGFIQLFK